MATRRSKQHKHVLIIAYAFPPVGGAGVQRPAKFVKYLRLFGWEPVVLTCANPSVPVIDSGLAKEIPDDIKIHTARTFEPSYKNKTVLLHSSSATGGIGTVSKIKSILKKIIGYMLLPDVQVLWWPGLIWRLIVVLRKDHFDCVFVTAPPFSSLVPVVILCKLFNVPVVADFRDEWTFNRKNIENASRNRFVDWLDVFLERIVLSWATSVTAASGKYLEGMRSRHPEVPLVEKSVVITNGFDSEDFDKVCKNRLQEKEQLRLVYSGTVWAATSLQFFMASVEELLFEEPALKDILSIRIIGRVVDSEKGYFQKKRVEDIVHLKGYCSHEKALEEISNADLLLLTLSDSPESDRIIPAKTFEYMATGKPVLALVPSGEVEDILLANYPSTWIEKPNDVQRIKRTLRSLIDDFRNGRFNSQNQNVDSNVEKFSRMNLTKRLAQLLDEIGNS